MARDLYKKLELKYFGHNFEKNSGFGKDHRRGKDRWEIRKRKTEIEGTGKGTYMMMFSPCHSQKS